MGFYEIMATFCFVFTAAAAVYLIFASVREARIDKKMFDNQDSGLFWAEIENGDIDYDPKRDVYDWKKDAPNDFS